MRLSRSEGDTVRQREACERPRATKSSLELMQEAVLRAGGAQSQKGARFVPRSLIHSTNSWGPALLLALRWELEVER